MTNDLDRWKTKDKAWQANRKEQWLDIEKRLELSEKFTKKEIKTYKSYFLRGRVPKWDKSQWGWDDDPIPLLFRLWFDPDQSQERWQVIMDEVLNYEDSHVIKRSLQVTMDLFFSQADNYVTYSGISAPNGFIGGDEKRFFDFLIGPSDASRVIKFSGGEVSKKLNFRSGYYFSMHQWLSTRQLHNSYKVSQFALEHWYRDLTDDYCAKLVMDHMDIEDMQVYLVSIAQYTEPDKSSDDQIREKYCAEVREILNNRPLPKQMQHWWNDAKNKHKE